MDELRQSAGVSLRRLYSLYPSKSDIVLAVLARKHDRWARELDGHLASRSDPLDRLLVVYDYLALWFRTDDFRGCGFINAFGELGGQDAQVAAAVREYKASFPRRVAELVDEADGTPQLAAQLAILAEGAQTTAAIAGDPDAALIATGVHLGPTWSSCGVRCREDWSDVRHSVRSTPDDGVSGPGPVFWMRQADGRAG